MEMPKYQLPDAQRVRVTLIDVSTWPFTWNTLGQSGAPPPPGKFPDVVWRVSWNLSGNLFAVSCGDGRVTLWKEKLKLGVRQ